MKVLLNFREMAAGPLFGETKLSSSVTVCLCVYRMTHSQQQSGKLTPYQSSVSPFLCVTSTGGWKHRDTRMEIAPNRKWSSETGILRVYKTPPVT